MKTVKQVSELTGISVRTLHYYDEIGLLKPSKVTEAGYRMYDNDALQVLQQILFFRELDFPLKDIKTVMLDPNYDKKKAFENQRMLIQVKRDRLNNLLNLLDKLIKGEECMSFKEFDMSEYTSALEDFIKNNTDEIIEFGGDLNEFNNVLEMLKSDSILKSEIAEIAIKQYGSIEQYTEAMKENMHNFPDIMKQMYSEKDTPESCVAKTNELTERLTSDLSKDVSSEEIQHIVSELVNVGSGYSNIMNMGDNYWEFIADGYLSNKMTIDVTDKKYGNGASAFIGNALKVYFNLK